jgi:hypothetical protein
MLSIYYVGDWTGGEVFYPCLEIGNYVGNILDVNSLHHLRQKGINMFGPQPQCDTRCHPACAPGFSLLFKNPFPYIYDQFKKFSTKR